MNGIEALHQLMNDPKLEIRMKINSFDSSSWHNYADWLKINNSASVGHLIGTSYEVRKRESNMDNAIEELRECFPCTESEHRTILSKYIKD